MHLKLAVDAQVFRNEQSKMIYINSRLEAAVKDQLYLFINNDFTFRFANADAVYLSHVSL